MKEFKEGDIINSVQLANDYGCFKTDKETNSKLLSPLTIFSKTELWVKDDKGEICPLREVKDAVLVS